MSLYTIVKLCENENQIQPNKTIPINQDAPAIVSIISTADAETLFLARNPGELCTTVEREEAVIEGALADEDSTWFVAEYEGRLVGQCSMGLVRRYQRYRHRAEVAFVILKDYQGFEVTGTLPNALRYTDGTYADEYKMIKRLQISNL